MKKLLLITAALILNSTFLIFNCSAQTALTAAMQEIGNHQINKTLNSHNHPSQNSNSRAITSLVPILDSEYIYSWDTLSIGWSVHPYMKIKNVIYDAHNNLTSYLSQILNGTAWVNKGKSTMTYDANNNSTSDLEQNWVNSAWVNSYQYISTYDANNNNTIELNQSWINGAWVSTNKYTYTYDANHNKTSELTDTGAVLGHEYKYTYTYDTHNNKITQIYNGGWNGTIWTGYNDTLQYINVYDYVPNLISSTAQNKYQGVWQDQDKHTYTYDGNNNKTIDLHESWNGSVWVNSGKTLYTYDAHNNKTSELPLTWDNTNSVWVNSSNGYKYIYVYDANNNQTNELDQRWNGSTWINIYQNSNNFDANNFEKSWAYKDWNNTGTKITSGDSSHIYFHTVTGINEIAIENNVMIYPNPFTFQTTISFDKEIKNANIKIIDILGKEVKTVILSGAKNLIIEKGDMKAGIYFVQIIDENKNVMNRKIMIQ